MRIFIDGGSGTTGLRIVERMQARADVELITLSEADRKVKERRKEALNSCDAAFLCLPDDAAREAVSLVENPCVRILDTSTAHRTQEGWAYGFPELSKDFEAHVRGSKRVAVPGCHASGFIALVYPLIEAGILPRETGLTCHSVTGFSGGGKSMIAQYRDPAREADYDSPRQYATAQAHKHLPEMTKVCGLAAPPIFCPIVADFYSGMVVTVPLFLSQLAACADAGEVKRLYREKYTGPFVRYRETLAQDGFISANALAGKDYMEISVEGNEERLLLVARFDNLGKGASGAAMECMNLMMGADPAAGLAL